MVDSDKIFVQVNFANLSHIEALGVLDKKILDCT